MYDSKIYYDLADVSKMWLEALEGAEGKEAEELKRRYEKEYKMYIDIAKQFDYEMGLA